MKKAMAVIPVAILIVFLAVLGVRYHQFCVGSKQGEGEPQEEKTEYCLREESTAYETDGNLLELLAVREDEVEKIRCISYFYGDREIKMAESAKEIRQLLSLLDCQVTFLEKKETDSDGNGLWWFRVYLEDGYFVSVSVWSENAVTFYVQDGQQYRYRTAVDFDAGQMEAVLGTISDAAPEDRQPYSILRDDAE